MRMEETRLQKYIAMSGVASRRKAEEIIRAGRVTVDGQLVTDPAVKVTPGNIVEVDGKKIEPEGRKVYIMLHKPVGYITAVSDQFSRPTVMDLVKGVRERVYPVGRLDYDTSGLLLMTNDGDFANRIMHPRYEKEKTYVAEIKGFPDRRDIEAFSAGLKIEDYITKPAKIRIIKRKKSSTIVEITIHEGRNRQVRKMCEAIGHPVINLKRTAIGPLKLGDLPEGQWRFLKKKEIKKLDGGI